IGGAKFFFGFLSPWRLKVVVRPTRRARERYRTRMREPRRLLVIVRLASAIEPGRDTGIDVDRDTGVIGNGLLHLRHCLRRDLRVILGKVGDKRTGDPLGEVETQIETAAVIGHWAIATALRRS